MTQSKAREKVEQLIEKFRREQAAGQINQYNESETKTGFIEPLLQALGWNTQDRNEVGLEEKISGGRVDYSLKIKGSPKIYIEAKPPRARLTKQEAISQAITYGYNKRSVSWVLLTDFQELRLFDVTIRPNEEFSGKGQAAHICKTCAKKPEAKREEAIALNRISRVYRYGDLSRNNQRMIEN